MYCYVFRSEIHSDTSESRELAWASFLVNPNKFVGIQDPQSLNATNFPSRGSGATIYPCILGDISESAVILGAWDK